MDHKHNNSNNVLPQRRRPSGPPLTPEQEQIRLEQWAAEAAERQAAWEKEKVRRPRRPADNASRDMKVEWLLKCYGYCAPKDRVIDLFEPSGDCELLPKAFAQLFSSWYENVAGPRGGLKTYHAVNFWSLNPTRKNIRAVCMRPDMPFPTYEEDGHTFKNTYRRPQHEGTGDLTLWHEFMIHLLPAEIEREWYLNWLAHKYLHPEIPGVSIVMVAAGTFGCGRGKLAKILAKLLGPQYVRSVEFDVFTGKSPQGQFTDFSARSVLTVVSESKDTADSGRWSDRRATYERLKSVMDPDVTDRWFTVKYGTPYQAQSYASYVIFSNHNDAFQLPAGDRRVTVLANGADITAEKAAALTAWTAVPGNIAELARWLEARDLTNFNIYKPLETETKTLMQELARTDLDDAWSAVRKQIGDTALFTGEQVRSAVQAELGDYSSGDDIRRWVMRRLRATATQVEDFRTLPIEGRHKILRWRGCEPPPLLRNAVASEASEAAAHKVAEGKARDAVTATGKILSPLSAFINSRRKPDSDSKD